MHVLYFKKSQRFMSGKKYKQKIVRFRVQFYVGIQLKQSRHTTTIITTYNPLKYNIIKKNYEIIIFTFFNLSIE